MRVFCAQCAVYSVVELIFDKSNLAGLVCALRSCGESNLAPIVLAGVPLHEARGDEPINALRVMPTSPSVDFMTVDQWIRCVGAGPRRRERRLPVCVMFSGSAGRVDQR